MVDEKLIEYALDHIDIAPLMTKIREIMDIFGGVVYAFDMEWKIRVFIVAVLDFCLLKKDLDTEMLKTRTNFKFNNFDAHDGLKIDGEKAVE